MATPISPGVYSKIIDLSEYLTSESGTIGFLPVLTEQGRDNELVRISSVEEYLTEFGQPNIRAFGKYYGQGPYVALQHLSVSSDLYVLRALPDDAAYSHAYIGFVGSKKNAAVDVDYEGTAEDVGPTTESGSSTVTDIPQTLDSVKLGCFYASKKMTNTQRLNSYFTAGGTAQIAAQCPDIYSPSGDTDKTDCNKSVLMYIRGYGRGDYYDKLSFMLRADSKASNFGLYNFEIYQDQDGDPVMIESYNVSFDPLSTDADGESNFIEEVVNKFSKTVAVEVNTEALDVLREFTQNFYKNDPDVSELYPVYTINDTDIQLKVGKGFPVGVPVFYTKLTAPDDLDTTTWGDDEGHVCMFNENVTSENPSSYIIVDPEYDEETGVATPDLRIPEGYELGIKATAIWKAYCKKAAAQFAMHKANAAYNVAVDETDVELKDAKLVAAITLINQAQLMVDSADSEFDNAKSMSIMELTDSDNEELGAQPYYLKMGSLGSIVTNRAGKRATYSTVADQTLCLAYSGLLKKPVCIKKVDESTGTVKWKVPYANNILDMDWIYFTLVYDAGYKPDVKEMAKQLVEERGDCVLISDCGDNSDCEDVERYVGSVKGARDCRIWNSFYCARYEPYTRVYDEYTGTDQWMSPVYTLAKLIPQNDALYDVWYATAGFNRGVSSEIKELRWSPNKGERDRLYLAQVNPIVYFPEGMTVFSQLTSQKKTSTLSDLNCVRTVLYIKRAVEQFCKNYLFEFNDSVTHDAIKNNITPFLDTIVAARGLKEYSVEVGATEYEYKTKTCHVNLTLAPMKVIEKIQLNMYIK